MMGAICTVICAGIVLAIGVMMLIDEWLDGEVRFFGLVGILAGIGALLAALVVW